MRKDVRPIVLNEEQQAILAYIRSTPPLDYIEQAEHFIARATSAWSAAKVLGELRKIVIYCADHPRWEATRRNWNQTARIWIAKAMEQEGNAGKIAGLLGSIKPVPRKERGYFER